jgi:hypothetical protein
MNGGYGPSVRGGMAENERVVEGNNAWFLDYGSRVRVGMGEKASLLGKGTMHGSWVRWGRMLSPTIRWNGKERIVSADEGEYIFSSWRGGQCMFLVGRGGFAWFLVVRKCLVPRLGLGEMTGSWVMRKCVVHGLLKNAWHLGWGGNVWFLGFLEIAWHFRWRKWGSWVVGKCIVPELQEKAWFLCMIPGLGKIYGCWVGGKCMV